MPTEKCLNEWMQFYNLQFTVDDLDNNLLKIVRAQSLELPDEASYVFIFPSLCLMIEKVQSHNGSHAVCHH